jgi:hypothetical protein
MRKPHKYGAKATTLDGIRFASIAESRRYAELLLLQKAGEIECLELQPRFPIIVKGITVATYIGDFRYRVVKGMRGSLTVVEDVKGVRTPVYQLKKKLVRALYDIAITEV